MSEVAPGILGELPLSPEVGSTNDRAEKPKPGLDAEMVRKAITSFVHSPAFVPSLVLALGLGLVFWPLLSGLPELWLGEDGYYSHGFLIPFLSGYMIYLKWPRISQTPVKGSTVAWVVLLGLLWCSLAAQVTRNLAGASLFLMLALVAATAIVAGWRWAKHFLGPILYLSFCLPMWSIVIDNFTAPLQGYSTTMAFSLLKLTGFSPLLGTGDNASTIYLNNFTLNVAVPCSGLKLLIAVTAFSLLFISIGDLKIWGKAFMIGITLPLCIFINGLRIAMIGMVGDTWGDNAGHQFHDYSGYITLGVCFFILMRITRMLGWK